MKKITKESVSRCVRFVSEKTAAFTVKYPIWALGIWALILNLVIEMLSRRSLALGLGYAVLHPYLFLYNTLILFACISPALLFRKRIFAGTLLSAVWLILGVTNCIMLGMRTTPFSAIDLSLLKSCFDIIDIYLSIWQIVLIVLGLLLLILLLVLLFIKTPKQHMPLKKSLTAVFGAILTLTLATVFSLQIGALSTKFPDLPKAYKEYGFPYCFSLSFIDRGVSKPADYSGDRMEDLLSSIETQGVTTGGKDETEETAPSTEDMNPSVGEAKALPNIVFVQLESFFDVNRIAGLHFSENPIPVFTHLKESCPSGTLSVPSIGAGTANTEFEVLTGMNLDDFGAGEYPYKTILRTSTSESVAYNLKKLGYKTHALHNNGGSFYDRNLVYPSLGFDTFTSLEYMQNVEYNPLGWAKDMVLTDEILIAMESTDAPDFVFAVSVQPHGKYPEEETKGTEDDAYELGGLFDRLFPKNEDETASEDEADAALTGGHSSGNATTVLTPEDLAEQHISVEGLSDERLDTQYTYYVNQLYETDAFIGALLAAFSAYDEPVMLVLYGDHLPAIEIPRGGLAEDSELYASDYAMWTNYEPNVPQKKDLEAFQLAADALGRAGISEGLITVLHQTMAEKDDYLASLELLEYDMLYGEKTVWDGINPYLPTAMRMGVRNIVVTNVYIQSAESPDFYVIGENFTPFSRVFVNDKRLDTEYLNDTTLRVVGKLPQAGDRITVAQMGGEFDVLSQTSPFLYVE